MRTIGLTLGKFLPFHKGHELLIQTSFNLCDYLIVLVGTSEGDPFSFEQRFDWIAHSVKYPDYADMFLRIIEQPELDKDAPKDEFGTITDESYWKKWLNDTHERLAKKDFDGHITHVFTSDVYGERIAKELGAIWVPVDPDRENIPISGTKVRSNFQAEYKYLPWYVRESLVKKVAILGPESTGKSTITKALAEKFQAPFATEYGRIIAKARGNKFSKNDFDLIFEGQKVFIRNAVGRTYETPLVISDTESITTEVWYEYIFGETPNLYHFDTIDFDLYILLAPSVPFIQDGTRLTSEDERWWMYYEIKDRLVRRNKKFVEINEKDWHVRFVKAQQVVEKVLK